MIQKGFKFNELDKQPLADKIAEEFLEDLNRFHSKPYPIDKETDMALHKAYYEIMQEDYREKYFKDVDLYFSPSSATSCPRELFLKNKGHNRDAVEVVAHRTRWQNIGTAIGDMIQKDVLLMEKHLDNNRFAFNRVENNYPQFEEFAYIAKPINFNGNKFHLVGTTDGIMQYKNMHKVGLEIKSKQTSYSGTGYYSMKEADPKHVAQCVAYSLMYGVNYWVICYVNASKKSWNMTEEDIAKYPDVRTFGIYITDDMKLQLLSYLSDVVTAIKEDKIPELDITKWTFNNYKEACIKVTTLEEIEKIRVNYNAGKYNFLPKYQLKSVLSSINYIEERIKNRG